MSEKVFLYIITSIILLIIAAFILMTLLVKGELRLRKRKRRRSDKRWTEIERGLNTAFTELEYFKKMKAGEESKSGSDKKRK